MPHSPTTVPETQFDHSGEPPACRIPTRDNIFRNLALQRGLLQSRPHVYPEVDERLLRSPRKVQARYGTKWVDGYMPQKGFFHREDNGHVDRKSSADIREIPPSEGRSVVGSGPVENKALLEALDVPCAQEDDGSSNKVTPVKPSNMENYRNNSAEKSVRKGSLTPNVKPIDYAAWVKHRTGKKWFPARKTGDLYRDMAPIQYYGVEQKADVLPSELAPLLPQPIAHPYEIELNYGSGWHRVKVIQEFEGGCFMFERHRGLEVRRGRTRPVVPDVIEETPEDAHIPTHSHDARSSEDSTPEKTTKPKADLKRKPIVAADNPTTNVNRQLFTESRAENALPEMGDIIETIPLKPERFEQEEGIVKEMTPKKSKTAPAKKSHFVKVNGYISRPDSKNPKKSEKMVYADVLYPVPPGRKGQESYMLKGCNDTQQFLISELKCHENERPIIIPREDINIVYVLRGE